MRPRNSQALAARLRARGVPVELRVYPELGHIGVLLAIARPFGDRAPVLPEVARFVADIAK